MSWNYQEGVIFAGVGLPDGLAVGYVKLSQQRGIWGDFGLRQMTEAGDCHLGERHLLYKGASQARTFALTPEIRESERPGHPRPLNESWSC
jgi:hypothetical protein